MAISTYLPETDKDAVVNYLTRINPAPLDSSKSMAAEIDPLAPRSFVPPQELWQEYMHLRQQPQMRGSDVPLTDWAPRNDTGPAQKFDGYQP